MYSTFSFSGAEVAGAVQKVACRHLGEQCAGFVNRVGYHI